MIAEIREEASNMMKQWESKINKEYNSMNKKVKETERNIQNKMKLIQS